MKVFGAIENVQIEWFTDAGKPSAASNPYRIIYVTDLKELQISDGTTWTKYQGASMAAQTIKGNPTSATATAQDISIASGMFYRNKIINGGMRIDQRNNGAAVTAFSFPVDRFFTSGSGGGAVTSQRSTTVPTGFINSTSLTVATADASVASGDFYEFTQSIEGNLISEFNLGTANATQFTLSFWVRSSIAGTYCVSFRNNANNRSYVAEYTINAINTWEQKSITLTGDTTGTWETGNSRGLTVSWNLGSGSSFQTTAGAWQAGSFTRTANQTNWISTLSATFFITGVQLEQGAVATPFERRPQTIEESLCYRYYWNYTSRESNFKIFGIGWASSTTIMGVSVRLPVTMRVAPSVGFTAASNFAVQFAGNVATATNMALSIAGVDTIMFEGTRAGMTAGDGGMIRANTSTDAQIQISAEF